jgi:Cu-Zn family superoxide dismutase
MRTSLSRGLSLAAVLAAGSIAAGGAALASSGMSTDTARPRAAATPAGTRMAQQLDMPMPDGTMPDGTMPDGTMPDGTMPDGTMPGGAMPSDAMSTGSTGLGSMPSMTAEPMRRGNEYNRRLGSVEATLHDVDGRQVGWVRLVKLQHGGSLVRVRAWGLAPGFHGFHLHTNGICDPAGAKPFASAGGHFNPTGTAEGMQAGAFPVLLAGPDGRAAARFVDANVVPADLVTPTGTSVVVHSLPDNYANIPIRYTSGGVAGPDQETMMTGDGGARVACGVLVRPAH